MRSMKEGAIFKIGTQVTPFVVIAVCKTKPGIGASGIVFYLVPQCQSEYFPNRYVLGYTEIKNIMILVVYSAGDADPRKVKVFVGVAMQRVKEQGWRFIIMYVQIAG